jgi:hypothetical protein
MGNPHPTNSKPVKIGRKHTGAPSLRTIGRRASGKLKLHRAEIVKWRAFKKEVAAYWRGERETYPKMPNDALCDGSEPPQTPKLKQT